MANTNSDVTFRGHAEIIVRKLQQKPMTAQQILKATNGTTPHNSWSLARIAERHGGLVLRTIDGSENRDGGLGVLWVGWRNGHAFLRTGSPWIKHAGSR